MKKPLVIFGLGEAAELAHFYFTNQTAWRVVAFTVDQPYVREPLFCGLPVVAFEQVVRDYPPQQHDFFVGLGYSKLNALRKEKYLAAKALGYRLASFISSRALMLNQERIGEHCFILEGNIIQPFVTIGHNVSMWSGNTIGHHTIIRDHVFMSGGVVIAGGVEIGEQCFIGVRATLRDRIKVGEQCVVGAGAILLADAAPGGVYMSQATPRARAPSTRLRKL